ncbi:hypothetical protein NLJ89_g7124 [Agrocybe chaxingu]|uniref:Uncharacterized protein n=1 Tax=Agrocybe chaxingu TaxID=84603 RepID=A0A9W8JWZ1_9AGAR|nr:hypothetical protein NLJ89_g7124 [Agrocybe chaxingu]
MPPRQRTSEQIECPICQKVVTPQGLGAHQRGQPCRDERARQDLLRGIAPPVDSSEAVRALEALAQEENEAGSAALALAGGRNLGIERPPDSASAFQHWDYSNTHFGDGFNDNVGPSAPAPSTVPSLDSRTGKAPDIFSFIDYCGMESTMEPRDLDPSLDKQPWRPFATRLDFEFAEVFLDSHMNQRQIDTLISLVRQSKADGSVFTLTGATDLTKIWDVAQKTHTTGFAKRTFKVEYKGEELEYDVWVRPLWHWCQELLLDKNLIGEFHWNAEQLFKFDGQHFERFIDEPWTADAWWNYQTTIPSTAKPFCIIVYADKTRLSSFGTEKGYPVLARCANLPVDLRNGSGVGGGRLVGWLPIPEDVAGEKGKRRFVNLKREIWHEAVAEIVASIELYTKLGAAVQCADGVTRQLFPHILMLSADFEEQTMMALTRGSNGSFPCPICLVPKASIPDLSITYRERTTEEMQRIWHDAQALNQTQREELLSQYSLRDVQNIFWSLHGVDVYRALSWDRLHAYHGGLFSDHLLVELKAIVKKLPGRTAEIAIDHALQAIPPWSGLNHFTMLSASGEYADGTKHEDLSKVIIFASLEALNAEASPDGFALLQLMRSYLELDMFASLTVHTERTLADGQLELRRFEEFLKKYQAVQTTEKAGTFPKAHSHQHVFRDIRLKGATRNYNTKPNEKANGPLKKYYQRHTNFKNVAPQVLQISEMDLVSTMIRTNIDIIDESQREKELSAQEPDSDNGSHASPAEGSGACRVFHGSFGPAIPLVDVESQSGHDAVFQNFRRKLNKYLVDRSVIRRGTGISPDTSVTPYRFIKVIFSSVIDWRWNSHILRAYPIFYDKPRYDFALVKLSDDLKKCMLVQIIYPFKIMYNSTTHHLALVIPFDVPKMPANRARDNSLRLTRVHPRRRSDAVVIDTNSIIRGVLLVEDPGSPAGERLLVNFTDEDIWVRMKSVELPINVRL